MNISTEHIPQCNQSEPLADASGRIVDLMNENAVVLVLGGKYTCQWQRCLPELSKQHPL